MRSLAAADKLAILARATGLLASSVDLDATMAHTIAACLPALGDFGFFDVRVGVGDDTVRRTARAHDDETLEAMLRETRWARSERTDLNLCALSSGEVGFHPDIDDAWYRRAAVNDEHLAVLRKLAFTSMITVPMRYQGELLGALTLFFARSGRRHTEDDVAFASELATLAVPLVVTARVIEEHRQVQSELRTSEERLRLATHAGQLGVWDWNIVEDRVEWSERIYELHGLAPGQFGGTVGEFARMIHPDDAPRVHAALERSLATGADYMVEFRPLRPDGEERWLAARAAVVRDASGKAVRMLGATLDVTDRVRLLAAEREVRTVAEAASRRLELLAHAGERFSRSLEPREILQQIGEVIAPSFADWCRVDLIDDAGVLRHAHSHHADAARLARALEVADDVRDASLDENILAQVAATGTPMIVEITPAMLDALPDIGLAKFVREIGLRALISVPLVARGHTLGVLSALIDRTSTRRRRDFTREDIPLMTEIANRAALALTNARLYAEAERARRDAEAASRAKDEFLAILGHELRNPLAPIVAALELLDHRGEAAALREREIIGRQVQHLSRLVDDLLDVSRIVRGKVELDRQRVDLAAVIEKALEMAAPLFAQRQQHPAVHLEGPCWVIGDPVRLAQVVSNLLTNASKFTPPRGRIEVTLANGEVIVRDHGIGIAPELLPNIFGLFVQGPQALDRRQGGLGLGLALVHNLVEMHGGTVTAESAGLGQGATFRVHLPPAPADAAQGPIATAAARATGRGQLLIVDDNVDAGELLGDLVRLRGYDVEIAASGDEALARAEACTPDLAILDIGLPGMDGYELARRLRARFPGLRLIAMTGYGRDSDRALAREAGFDHHLVKPVTPDRLLDAVARLLDQRQTTAPNAPVA